MGDRNGAGCVVGTTQVMVNGIGPQDISSIDVYFDLNLDYTGPIPELKYTKYGGDPRDIRPIKSLRGMYNVHPVIRYHFENFFTGGFGYPLLNIRVKILPNPEPLVEPPCAGDNCPAVTCTPVHPFMIWNGPLGVPLTPTLLEQYAKIVPAYCLKQGDRIFLDPSPTPAPTAPMGIIESIILMPPQEVYGLWVMDGPNAANVTEAAVQSLIALVNQDLADSWTKGTIINPVGADDFACNKFDFYWNELFTEKNSIGLQPPLSNGLQFPEEFMIITDSIATGTLNVQYGYYKRAREGFALDTLVP
jgi:hypothetical protein